MVAHYLKTHNPTAKIIVTDPKAKFSKMALFVEGWGDHYQGMIDWIGEDFGGGNVEVDPAAMTVTIDGDVTPVDVCNVIPAMKAGRIADLAGVTDGHWAPVHAQNMASKVDPHIHVLGDSAQQGICPNQAFPPIARPRCQHTRRIDRIPDFPALYANTCWSLIAADDGVKVGATYEATDEKIARIDGFISQPGETADLRRATYESEDWYAGMTADMFG